MTFVLDAGALIAIERCDREMIARLNAERIAGRVPVTHGGVVGQVWRGGPRQATLVRALRLIEVAPLDDDLGRRAGALLGAASQSDVIDAALVALAVDGDEILTSDPDDLIALAIVAGTHLELDVI